MYDIPSTRRKLGNGGRGRNKGKRILINVYERWIVSEGNGGDTEKEINSLRGAHAWSGLGPTGIGR